MKIGNSILIASNAIMMGLICSNLVTPIGALGADKEPPKKEEKKEPAKTEVSIFVDKKLEEAVRKYVFEKRDNDKPIVEADVATISTIQGKGLGITNLAGLEKCKALASLELPNNKIRDISPIKELAGIQLLDLAHNQIDNITPIAGIMALQYINFEGNLIKDISVVAGLTNLASIYLTQNRITDMSPVVKLPKISSLYLDGNQIKTITGIGNLHGMMSCSLAKNQITDIAPLEGLNGIFNLFLEDNKIKDLGTLVKMAEADKESRFAPFLNLYLKGNPLSSQAKRSQIPALKKIGVRVNE